jgi:hypothetical protein
VTSLHFTYAEIQTFENNNDNVFNGILWYRIYTGSPSGAFTSVTLSTFQALGNGDEKRSVTMNIDLLNGLSPSTTYTLEIYFQAEVDWLNNGVGKDDDIYHSNGGNNYKLTFTTAAAMPVELKTFLVNSNRGQLTLSWITASERNNSHFDVQRSADSRTWNNIGTVQGNGTTYQQQVYNFTDWFPLDGTNYYRLKQVDFNDNYEYSKVVSVNYDPRMPGKISPNPAKDELRVETGWETGAAFSADIYDMQGKLLRKNALQPDARSHRIDLDGLPNGLLLLRLTDAAGRTTLMERFLKN